MHEEWGIVSSEEDQLLHAVPVVRNKLLSLVNKHISKYSKSTPSFCAQCIAEVKKRYPEEVRGQMSSIVGATLFQLYSRLFILYTRVEA
jgi:hypothetical protein